MPMVSIIIPVYNTEAYLEKCLDSVINQTHRNIEIIVLNDGSTDGSHDIMMSKYVSDLRVTYVTHENRGLGPTRNRGIEIATSDYVCFVDSDDFIDLDMIDLMVQDLKEYEADIVCCEHYRWIDDEDYTISVNFITSRQISLSQVDHAHFIHEYLLRRVYAISSCAKLYKTDVIRNNNVQFGDNRRVFAEDRYFNLCLLAHVDQIRFIHRPLYYYRQRPGSIMNSFKPDLMQRHLNMMDDIREFTVNSPRGKLIHKITSLFLLEAINKEVANIMTYQKGIRGVFRIFHLLQRQHSTATYIQEIIDQRLDELLVERDKLQAKRILFLMKHRLYLWAALEVYLNYRWIHIKRFMKNKVKHAYVQR